MPKSRSYRFIISKPSNKDLANIKEKLWYDYLSIRYNDSNEIEGFIHHKHQIDKSALENKISNAVFENYDFKDYTKNYAQLKNTLIVEVGIPPHQGKKPNITDVKHKIIDENQSIHQIFNRYPILTNQSTKYTVKLINEIISDLTLPQKMELLVAIFANKIKQSKNNSNLSVLFVSILSLIGFKINSIGDADYQLFVEMRSTILTFLAKNKLTKLPTSTFDCI